MDGSNVYRIDYFRTIFKRMHPYPILELNKGFTDVFGIVYQIKLTAQQNDAEIFQ